MRNKSIRAVRFIAVLLFAMSLLSAYPLAPLIIGASAAQDSGPRQRAPLRAHALAGWLLAGGATKLESLDIAFQAAEALVNLPLDLVERHQ